MTIHHNSQDNLFRNPVGAAVCGSQVKLAIQAPGASEVLVRSWTDDRGEYLYPMQRDGETFRCCINMPCEPGLFWYFFIVKYADGSECFYGNNSQNLGGIGETGPWEPHSYQITVYKNSPAPDWFKKCIAYQIFPDRFYCHDKNNPKATVEWYSKPKYKRNPDGSIREWDFYGGSLKGIAQKMPYIASLGVGAIYLNPIFAAESNHRYDTLDYMTIDPRLGTEEDFIELSQTAAKYNIGIILDGVFSHTGINSHYLAEHPEWYNIDENGNLKYWWGVKDLPEVNELSDGFTELICGSNGVLRHWIRLGAMGFRLDVADELPDRFIKLIRKVIKEENPCAVLIGEVWEDASNKVSLGEKRQYFMGEELDSVMNYPLRTMLLDFFNGGISSNELASRLKSLQENYPSENFYSCFNLIGSHDRERILTALGFEENNQKATQKLKALSALLYALPGVPVIYYGDEAGLTGGVDPENRAAYPWGYENTELINHYISIGKYRNSHKAFTEGSFNIISNDTLFVFERECAEEKITVVCNPFNITADFAGISVPPLTTLYEIDA